jgi:hypothetical protein
MQSLGGKRFGTGATAALPESEGMVTELVGLTSAGLSSRVRRDWFNVYVLGVIGNL